MPSKDKKSKEQSSYKTRSSKTSSQGFSRLEPPNKKKINRQQRNNSRSDNKKTIQDSFDIRRKEEEKCLLDSLDSDDSSDSSTSSCASDSKKDNYRRNGSFYYKTERETSISPYSRSANNNNRVRRSRSPNKQRRRQISPPSGGKMSPQRLRQRSPVKTRIDFLDKRHSGLILTAEQLLSQKQRLRPVRPSALRDLSLLPQNSLKNISVILKKAMNQRRDALERNFTDRDSFRSKADPREWSDWF